MSERLEELDRAALAGGGEERVERQHAAGKLTARERLDVLPLVASPDGADEHDHRPRSLDIVTRGLRGVPCLCQRKQARDVERFCGNREGQQHLSIRPGIGYRVPGTGYDS